MDAGVEEGDEVGLAYDPMIAKLVAHGRDRAEALDLLAAALEETEVAGVTTNLPFLRWLVSHPVVRAGEATTAFLTEQPPLSALPLRLANAALADAVAPQPPRPGARSAARRRRGHAGARGSSREGQPR